MSTQLLREKIANRLRREFEANLNGMVKQQLRNAKWIAARETTLAENAFAKINKILAKAKAETTVETATEQETC
jgi:uncharacterized protein YnzC (UPF0291/DUF896 family)